MTRAEVLNFLSACHLSRDICDTNCCQQIEYLLPEGQVDYDFCHGATKAVIVPDNENFVIKIPFNVSDGYYDEDEHEWDSEEELLNGNDDNRFYWDYCLQEVLVYRAARRAGVAKAFAQTKLIGHVKGRPIYIQPKVEHDRLPYPIDWDSKEYLESTHKTTRIVRAADAPSIPEVWAYTAYHYYGEAFFTKLINFLGDHPHINDLHGDNTGFLRGRPVLCDYSGYFEPY